MAGRRKLVVVANRGPVSFARSEAGERIVKRGGGGLVTSLRGLVTHHDVTWIGSAITDEDRAVSAEHGGASFDETWHDGSPYRLRLVAHDPAAYDRYYNVVANPTLWFVQHHLWGLAYAPDFDLAVHEAWLNGYARVNASFADAVVEELERDPGATVFFHDYHLYLAPALVRARQPDALLAHFVHIPWPDADAWSALPPDARRAVHEGLLANDVVGLHTERWRRNFLRACADILGANVDEQSATVAFGGRRTLVTAHPISIDPDEFETLRDDPAVVAEEQAIVAARPEHLVVRVDRTDLSKNVVRGFRAFGLFLDLYPEFHGRVTLLALLDPSRQDVPEYSEYLAAIQREARSVNERLQTDTWLPIDLQIADNFAQSVAAYKQYDVLLVNAVFDGLNLVSKEAPLVNERDGVLVLSENAGSHEEIGEWAISVNPFDVYGQAQAIHEALTMEAGERRRLLEAMRAYVREHDLAAWIAAQLADFDRVRLRHGDDGRS
ncbi:MAG TPA: trehalose-6-phosphate synthase [Gaiellaceae bacterium]|nr:trehalose-6-phosphate synthase [Gaiellaceae bacterium]